MKRESKDYFKRIAKIECTSLGFEDHGFFTAAITVDYGGSGQGIGLFCMSDVNEPDKPATSTPRAADFIIRVLRACGVEKWESLRGRTIYVLFDDDSWNSTPRGIENLPTEPGERFVFSDWQTDVKKAQESKS